MLGALPGLLLLVAGGLAWLFRQARRHHLPALGLVLLLPALVPVVSASAYDLTVSHAALPGDPVEESRELIQSMLLPQSRRGDEIFVYYGVADAFQVYAPRFLQASIVKPPTSTIHEHGRWLVFGAYPTDLRQSIAQTHATRVWLLLAHITPGVEQELLQFITGSGHIELAAHRQGADLYRVQFRP